MASESAVAGRTFHTGNEIFQIIGVVQKPFTGTDTGSMVDIFIPTMMVKNNGITRSDYQWFRTFVKLKPNGNAAYVRARLGEFSASLHETG